MANPQRSTNVITEAVGDGLGVYDRTRKQSYVLNATSALVFQHCDGQTTPEQLTELLRQRFNLSRGQAEQLLSLSLEKLHTAELLQRSVQRPANPGRRQLLKGLLATGLSLALMPVVAPVTVSVAAAATSVPGPSVSGVKLYAPKTYSACPTVVTSDLDLHDGGDK